MMQFWCQGRNDPCSGGLPEHPEFGSRFCKAYLDAKHTENVLLRVQNARETLQLANSYMAELGKGIYDLTNIKLSDRKVQEFINEFFPITEDLSDGQRKNNLRLQEDLKARYYNAPDLSWVGKNGWRFVNAVSDFATHADPIRRPGTTTRICSCVPQREIP